MGLTKMSGEEKEEQSNWMRRRKKTTKQLLPPNCEHVNMTMVMMIW